MRAADFRTDAWANLRRILNERLEAHRLNLEHTDDATASARLRGRIAEVKDLLALETAPATDPRPGFGPAVDPFAPLHAGDDSGM